MKSNTKPQHVVENLRKVKDLNSGWDGAAIYNVPETWYCVYSFIPDCDYNDGYVTEFNYEYILSHYIEPYEDDTSLEINVKSWGWGNTYMLLVSPDHPKLKELDELCGFLVEVHPVIDDGKYCQYQYDKLSEHVETLDEYRLMEELKSVGYSIFMIRDKEKTTQTLINYYIEHSLTF